MKRLNTLIVPTLFLLSVSLAPAVAKDDHHHEKHEKHEEHGHEMESLDAHVHGEVELNLVLDGDKLAVEMISPAMNIVGFEHAPSTKEQKQAVADAAVLLGKAESIFTIPAAADCKSSSVEVESSLMEDADHGEHKEHDGHDEHKDHDEHKEHAGHDDHDEHEEQHAEFHVTHELLCGNGGAIDSMTLNLFKTFPGVEKTKVQWILNGKQGAATTDAASDQLLLK